MEEWKDIPGYEGVYEVSDLGRIKSLARSWVWGRGAVRHQPDRILRPGLQCEGGYLTVNLVKSGISKNVLVHRIVAIAHISNPECKPEVNHKDGDKLNCRKDNLEWNTREENQQHAYKTGLHANTIQKCAESCRRRFSKPVAQYTKLGELVKVFFSEADAQRETGIRQSNINSAIQGKARSAGGFIWKRP